MKGLKLLLLCTLLSEIEAFAIECSCSDYSYVSVLNESVYSCNVNNLDIRFNSGPVTDIIRIHENDKTNFDVKLLKIHNQSCHEVPEKLGTFLVNLEGLEIVQSELKYVKKSSMADFKNLKYLNLMKNQIETLARDLFEDNLMLEVIVICLNKLKIIGQVIFDNLRFIRHIDLRRNPCLCKKIDNKVNLQGLKKEITKKCPPSIEVYCTYGDMDFAVGSFYTCEVRFWIIVIDYMTVSNFQGRQSSGKKNYNVHGLKVPEMTTKYLPINLLEHFHKLEAIEVVGAKMARLEKRDLDSFPHLKVLWLPRNNIEVLSNDVFEGNAKLEKISFYQNRLKFIGSEALMPLKNLKYINLEFNVCIDRYAHSLTCMEQIEESISKNCQPNKV